jgi:hypothetical protein
MLAIYDMWEMLLRCGMFQISYVWYVSDNACLWYEADATYLWYVIMLPLYGMWQMLPICGT